MTDNDIALDRPLLADLMTALSNAQNALSIGWQGWNTPEPAGGWPMGYSTPRDHQAGINEASEMLHSIARRLEAAGVPEAE